MTEDNRERRSTFRVQLQALVNLQVDNETFVSDTNLRDLSLDGVSLKTTKSLPLHGSCEFEITITGPSSMLQFSGKGRIIRQDSHGTAVKFTELEMDSYMHLKNIVLLNRAPDSV